MTATVTFDFVLTMYFPVVYLGRRGGESSIQVIRSRNRPSLFPVYRNHGSGRSMFSGVVAGDSEYRNGANGVNGRSKFAPS
ncbi:hypothetical protein X777_10442 [Ooceraea biroi]|uniref:Uncharacterized protein n=1 Tax=Ooceraea biroi TaxID=2015173 RepID=A0A026W698_OOCBI|nr:hypothetical protein X777_10442 [Ooceraea biroi]